MCMTVHARAAFEEGVLWSGRGERPREGKSDCVQRRECLNRLATKTGIDCFERPRAPFVSVPACVSESLLRTLKLHATRVSLNMSNQSASTLRG